MAKRFLYVSNEDPSQLLPHLREIVNAEFDRANNRHEALQALEREEYAGVVMTDLALAPGVLEVGETWPNSYPQAYQNGITVARTVKQKGLALVVLTSASLMYQQQLKSLGVDKVFKKVLEYRQFLDAVRTICKS